ncbi:hypothetical protein [Streptomyces boluensis]|uniref:Uncharacterized protein n=1 Tax=Streptomyces boluensis TaxID=1775135 RepID=A0A964UX57_9ACTN|nr:hypothetical protein [Streptomyces boluensis]NBE57071.1 hypothetical protein [Streptomyces boluensis]
MTDVFTVTVDGVDSSTLHGRVHVINPDLPFVPQEASFPLALLTDAWFLLAGGHLYSGGGMPPRRDLYPFREERGKTIVAGMRLSDEFQRLHARKDFSRRAPKVITDHSTGPLRNVPLWSEVAALDSAADPWDEEDLAELAELEGAADLSDWRTWALLTTRPFTKWPYADIVVTVSDPGYLEHMTAGMRWSTAVAWDR